jgi:hypothetical protein
MRSTRRAIGEAVGARAALKSSRDGATIITTVYSGRSARMIVNRIVRERDRSRTRFHPSPWPWPGGAVAHQGGIQGLRRLQRARCWTSGGLWPGTPSRRTHLEACRRCASEARHSSSRILRRLLALVARAQCLVPNCRVGFQGRPGSNLVRSTSVSGIDWHPQRLPGSARCGPMHRNNPRVGSPNWRRWQPRWAPRATVP